MFKTMRLSLVLALSCTLTHSVVGQEWELLYEEDFTSAFQDDSEWVLEDYAAPFDTIMEDNGLFFQNDYGPDFLQALNSFQTYRKEIPIGRDGWLTASLSARDWNKDGTIEREPTVSIVDMNTTKHNRKALRLDASGDHTSGVILRNSRPLPDEYRIEYKLMTLDFGGKRGGNIDYDDKINGYEAEGPVFPCKTQHPWGEGSATRGWEGSASAPYCEWQDVQRGVYGYNGFSFLTIVDFPNPAPRNNNFWHYHRKVLIDAFSQHPDRVGDETGGQVCNADINEYYDYRDSSHNIVNMWISGLPDSFSPNPGGQISSSQRFMTTCNGGKATPGIQAAAELQPELMPIEFYTFAIERNSSGYTMEVSGNFARSGARKIRLHRPFEVDGEPIWHYNTEAEEYDGRHNADLVQENWAHGSSVWPNQWPAGSAFPDSFVIGDLYTNAYEGVASVAEIKLYRALSSCRRAVFMTSPDVIQSGERLIHSVANAYLDFHANGNMQLWQGTPGKPEALLWESKVDQPITNTYFTELQNDGNLVTYYWNSGSAGRTIVWMTQLVGPVDGRTYSLIKECDEKGGNFTIYGGSAQRSEDVIWSTSVQAGHASSSTMTPIVEENVAATPGCYPTILMRSGDFLYPGKRVVNYQRGVFLMQKENGNVEVRWGSPEFPGDLLWESGFLNDDPDRSYYTKFEANSNLITWEITPDKSFTQTWELGLYRPILTPYFLVVDCEERNNRVAIYQSHPEESISGIVWSVDPPVDSSSKPIPLPTVPPTFSPSQAPKGENGEVATTAPTIREVEVDANQPVQIPGTSAQFTSSSATHLPLSILLLTFSAGVFFV